MPDCTPNTNSLRDMKNRVVGFTDVDPVVSPGLSRWGRIVDGLYAGSEQWWTVYPLRPGEFSPMLIRAKRVHTVMPKAY